MAKRVSNTRKIKNKLAQVMMERDAGKKLKGRVEMDDAYLGGEQSGGKRGRGSPRKTPIVAAVETTPDGKPVRLAFRRIKAFRKACVKNLARQIFEPGTQVVSDGLGCFRGVTDAGCTHVVFAASDHGPSEKLPCFRWVNTTLANIKNAITGTYRAARKKHAQRTLAEFEYRFNRRYDLAAMIPRLAYIAMRSPPMPYKLLKLAEDDA